LPSGNEQESSNVADTPTTAAANPLPAIIKGLDMIKGLLPMVTGMIPPPAGPAIGIGIPLIEDILMFAQTAHTSGTSKIAVADLLDRIAAHLGTVSTQLRA
jgi:hypothetical protein